jgi:regulator of replication initiation timing
MGLGGTAKKLQKVVDMAEELYDRLNYLREQLAQLQETVERTGTQVERLQREQAANRALLERLAEQQGIDVDEALKTASNENANPAPEQRQRGYQGQDGNQRLQGGQGQGQHGNQGQRGDQRQQEGQGQKQDPRGQDQQRQDQGSSSRSSFDGTSRRDDRPPGN